MNQDGAYDEAAHYVKGELYHFFRYVRDLEVGREMIEAFEMLTDGVARNLSSRMRKEMVLQSNLALSSRMDHRGRARHLGRSGCLAASEWRWIYSEE